MITPLFYGFIVVICLAISFVLSGMETGVFGLNRLRIRQKMHSGDPRAKVLLTYLEQPEHFLWTIMIGNTIANFFAVLLVAIGLHHSLGEWPVAYWSGFALFVFLLYAVGDLMPKMLFQTFPNRLCLALAGPFRFVHILLSPLVVLLTWISHRFLHLTGGQTFTGRMFGNREELRLIMQESAKGFTTEERSMINRVLDFQNLTVRQITIPLEKVMRVQAATPISEVLSLCRERGLTRLLVEQTVDRNQRILGIISLKTLLYLPALDPNKTAASCVKPALFLNEDLRLEDALRRMQRSGQRLAIVLDRSRQEVGIVSLQDILRAIFGDINL